jgi:two-component system alkaline phosphatase synthesis response regulator PhoP
VEFKIAIVEDNELIMNMIKINLEQNGYIIQCYTRGEMILNQLNKELFDLIILDLFLPEISGYEVLKRMRGKNINIPVLMLTVQSSVQDKVKALIAGADDYMVKPFNMDELFARISALIRRSHGDRSIPSNKILIINNFKINLSSRECTSNKGKVILSEKEIKLLIFFSLNKGQILRRVDILEEVWGMDVSPTPRTVDNFILKFRKLFENNPEKPEYFLSVRNKGYRFKSK